MLFAVIELAAFLLPGVLAMAGMPIVCLALLLVYWVAHVFGGNVVYKKYKESVEASGGGSK